MAKAIPVGPTVPRNRSGLITAGSVISHVASCTQLLATRIDSNATIEPEMGRQTRNNDIRGSEGVKRGDRHFWREDVGGEGSGKMA